MDNQALLVAIVDDEAEVGRALQRLLRSAGHRAEAFASGQDFLDWLGASAPDCVLLDIQMAGMSGFEVERQLNRDRPGLPCIFITASSDAAVLRRVAEQGAAVLHKPFPDEELFAALRRATAG